MHWMLNLQKAAESAASVMLDGKVKDVLREIQDNPEELPDIIESSGDAGEEAAAALAVPILGASAM